MLIDDLDSFFLHRNIFQEEVSRLRLVQNANELKEELRTMILKIQPLASIAKSLTRASANEEINICSPHIRAKRI